jgi:hypothetical protein
MMKAFSARVPASFGMLVNSASGTVIFKLDADGRLTEANMVYIESRGKHSEGLVLKSEFEEAIDVLFQALDNAAHAAAAPVKPVAKPAKEKAPTCCFGLAI